MRHFVEKLRHLFSKSSSRRRKPGRGWRPSGKRLCVGTFEDRVLLSATASGTVSGLVFVDHNGNGLKDALDAVVPGAHITLTGHTTFQNKAVDVSTTTDSNGKFTFANVQPGTYELGSSALSDFLGGTATISGVSVPLGVSMSGISISGGQTATRNFSVGGLKPEFVSLRQFLSSTTNKDFPFDQSGNGQGTGSSRANSAPIVKTAISNVSVGLNSSSTSIDLAGHFSDPDMANSQVTLNIDGVPIRVTLFDSQAPQTVANFFDYINSGDYNNTIFHRLVTGFVLQGGGFQFSHTGSTSSLTPLTTLQGVPNEFGMSNLAGTLAMAKLGGDPNSATSQFFFNLADNSSNLDNQNGGFTVFGKLTDPTELQTIISQFVTPAHLVTESSSSNPSLSFNDNPADFPVYGNYQANDPNFPGDATSANFLMLNSVTVNSRPEALTYSIVSNSNSSLVTAALTNERLNLTYATGQSGSATITVRATDKFGATVDTTFTVTVAPLSISTVTDPINAAAAANASASGVANTADAGDTISVTVNGGGQTSNAVTTTVGSDGTWSVSGIDASNIPDGAITYTATLTDAAGHTFTATKTATKDTTGPSLNISTLTNPINSVNDALTAISGTSESGATISVVASDGTNSTTAQTATAGTDGTWTVSGINVSSLADGTITYTVTATDSAGNATTRTQTATKDTVAPVVTISTATNPVNAANVTNTNISGTADAGDTISVVVTDGTHNTTARTATAAGDGSWIISGIDLTSLTDGPITYRVTATSTDGNTTTVTQAATKDTVAPVITIQSATDPINASNAAAAALSGTTEAGATITVVATDGTNSVTSQTVTAAVDGSWSVTGFDVSSLADGTITYTITATDAAGNTNQTTRTATKDTVPPTVALTSETTIIDNTVQTAVTASGTAEAGASISVVLSDGTHSTTAATTTAASDGTWTVTGIDATGLTDGTVTYTVTAADAAGNTATATATALKDAVTIVSATNPINHDNQMAVQISGTAEANAAIAIVISDGTNSVTENTTAAVDGTWSVSGIDISGLVDGSITYTVTATDASNNVATATLTATKSTVLPTIQVTAVTNPVDGTNETNTTVSGTASTGTTITVVVSDGTNTTQSFTTNTASDGTWSIGGVDVSALNDGTLTYTVTATDSAGNQSVATTTATKDTVTIVSATSPVNHDNQTAVQISGTAEANAAISIVISDGTNSVSANTTAATDGTWSVTGIDVSSLADGSITYTVTATDAGNNTATATLTATKNTVLPSIQVTSVTDPVDGTNVANTTASGTASAGAAISVVVTDGTTSTQPFTTTAASDGTWSISGIDVTSLANGSITYTATATDTFGNQASASLAATKNA